MSPCQALPIHELSKTGNMGLTWRNVSDGYFKTGPVRAVAVAESDPSVVYVGMGEHAPGE